VTPEETGSSADGFDGENCAEPMGIPRQRNPMKTLARRRDIAEIVQRIQRLRADTVPRWGRMSAHQMVCHLSDSFRMVSGRKRVARSTGPLQGTLLKWVALYLPLRWPTGLPTVPELDQESGGTKPGEFAADVADLEALLQAFTTESPTFDAPVHPVFGPMSPAGWLRWAYLHMDHHLRQFGV
jgi:DinB family protein